MAEIDSAAGLRPEFQPAFRMAAEAERKPVLRLENRKNDLETKTTLLGDLIGRVDAVKGMLPNLSTPFAFRELAIDSSDEKLIAATGDKRLASPGAHQFEILQLASPAQALSNGFPDRDQTRIGTGYFKFELANGSSREVFIDNDNATLDGVARSINQAKVGVRATVVQDFSDEDPVFRLVLSHEGTGDPNQVTYPNYYFVDPEEEFYFDQESPAQNARIKYEGFELEVEKNKLDELVPGLTIELKGLTAPGRPETLTIHTDIPQTTVKIKDLIDGLNNVFGFIHQQNTVDETHTQKRSPLGGDYALRMAQSRIQTALGQNYIYDSERSIRSTVDLGIRFTKEGLLEFDEKKFQAALNTHYDEVLDLLTGDGTTGVISRLSEALGSISGGRTGLLSTQKYNYTTQISKLNREITDKEVKAHEKTARLKQKLLEAQQAMDSIGGQSQVFSNLSNAGPTSDLIG